MKQWHVVYTQYRAETRAVEQLRHQGFETYFPRCSKVCRHARREETVLRPLFPRYVFVALDLDIDHWRSVNGTVGVSNLVSQGERPSALPDSVVENLRSSEIDEGVVALSRLMLFDVGAKLRVLEGAFVGQTGIYDGMSEAERVVLLFDMIGRKVRGEVPIHAVEAA